MDPPIRTHIHQIKLLLLFPPLYVRPCRGRALGVVGCPAKRNGGVRQRAGRGGMRKRAGRGGRLPPAPRVFNAAAAAGSSPAASVVCRHTLLCHKLLCHYGRVAAGPGHLRRSVDAFFLKLRPECARGPPNGDSIVLMAARAAACAAAAAGRGPRAAGLRVSLRPLAIRVPVICHGASVARRCRCLGGPAWGKLNSDFESESRFEADKRRV